MSQPARPSETLVDRPYQSSGLLALAIFLYAVWMTGGHFDFWRYERGLELTFNSMLAHLSRGEFDVDPDIVGLEGFSRDGRVYAYWGIFNALLRLPLMLFEAWEGIDVTRLSCFVAVSLSALLKLRILQLLTPAVSERTASSNLLYWSVAFSLLFSGAQIQFLNPSLYQEVCLWSGTLGAGFVYVAIAGLYAGGFTDRRLTVMALLAGAALLCRVSIGIGLYAAVGLLLLSMGLRKRQASAGRLAIAGNLLAALAVLGVGAAITGFVNYQRWGNPLVFADHRIYLLNDLYPDHWPRVQAYGLFNPVRIPLGLMYYFLPLWVMTRADGKLYFEEVQNRLLDGMELPAGSFLLTDPLLIALATYAAWNAWRERRDCGFDRMHAGLLSLGLAIPGVLILSAIFMSHRYRIEFYPLLEFGAYLGYGMLQRPPAGRATPGRFRGWMVTAVLLGVLVSHVTMILYRVADTGPATKHLRQGVVTYHLNSIIAQYPALRDWLENGRPADDGIRTRHVE